MTLRGLKSLSLLLALCCLGLFIAEIKANSEPVCWDVNGHCYDAIDIERTWIQAFLDARSRSYQGLPGHLATLTSPVENYFVWDTFQTDTYWLGGFQLPQAKKTYSAWMWITGEPWCLFVNWGLGEPNDSGETEGVEDGEENFLHFWNYNGQWNDAPRTDVMPGYIIEYEEMPEQALLAPIKLRDIHQLTTTWANLKQTR
jgi:hypothetical protein